MLPFSGPEARAAPGDLEKALTGGECHKFWVILLKLMPINGFKVAVFSAMSAWIFPTGPVDLLLCDRGCRATDVAGHSGLFPTTGEIRCCDMLRFPGLTHVWIASLYQVFKSVESVLSVQDLKRLKRGSSVDDHGAVNKYHLPYPSVLTAINHHQPFLIIINHDKPSSTINN